MSEVVIVWFACLIIYRALCRLLDWHPLPLVTVTVHNYKECEDER